MLRSVREAEEKAAQAAREEEIDVILKGHVPSCMVLVINDNP